MARSTRGCGPKSLSKNLTAQVRSIQQAFAEHDPRSIAEWSSEWLQGDESADREIMFWKIAADLYTSMASKETSCEVRRDIFNIILICLSAPRDQALERVEPTTMDLPTAASIVDRYYSCLHDLGLLCSHGYPAIRPGLHVDSTSEAIASGPVKMMRLTMYACTPGLPRSTTPLFTTIAPTI